MNFDPTRRIMISPHASLKERSQGDALVLPERALRIGGSGVEILRLCAAETTGQSVLDAMQARYPDTPEIATEVRSFLSEMLRLKGIVPVTPVLERDP